MPGWHLAQYNVARALFGPDSPEMADFYAQVPAVNALAESSAGFVWRNRDDVDGPFLLVNLSVWESVEALRAFVYRSNHGVAFGQRARWFEKPAEPHYVMWWIPPGHQPGYGEGEQRLKLLRTQGPSGEAFTFAQPFPAPAEA